MNPSVFSGYKQESLLEMEMVHILCGLDYNVMITIYIRNAIFF